MDRTEKRVLIAVAAAVIVIVGVCAGVMIARTNSSSFEVPPFDASAVVGTPEITDERSVYDELELPVSEGKCAVALDAMPALNNGELALFFTTDEQNTAYVRVVLSGEDGSVVGESGVLRPGEYVGAIPVADSVAPGDTLALKILTYEPETYYSLGSASATLQVR